jgi:hypothetical protein
VLHDREPSQQDRERALRQRLGIPADAERAIAFAEPSHWDPNWLMTSPSELITLGRSAEVCAWQTGGKA